MVEKLNDIRSSLSDALIKWPIVNLRRQPQPLPLLPQHKDRLQESQLLLGEKVRLIKQEGEWSFVEAVEQPRYDLSLQKWEGYKGWVPSESLIEDQASSSPSLIIQSLWSLCKLESGEDLALSLGSCVELVDREKDHWCFRLPDGRRGRLPLEEASFLSEENAWSAVRANQLAEQFIGHPYFWGGRSIFRPDLPHSSMDCSGLIHLLYRVQGWCIPRDAHDQYLCSTSKPPHAMETGDLFFCAPLDRAERMDHVGWVFDKNHFIESTELSHSVRKCLLRERIIESKSSFIFLSSIKI